MLKIHEQRVVFPNAEQFTDEVRKELAGGYRVAARNKVMASMLGEVSVTATPDGEGGEVIRARLATLDPEAARNLGDAAEMASALLTAATEAEAAGKTLPPGAADVLPILRSVVWAVRGREAAAAHESLTVLPGAWTGGPDEERPVEVDAAGHLIVAVAHSEVTRTGERWAVRNLRLHLGEEERRQGLVLRFRTPAGELLEPGRVTSRLLAPGVFRVTGESA